MDYLRDWRLSNPGLSITYHHYIQIHSRMVHMFTKTEA
jgi:hypothetical protein